MDFENFMEIVENIRTKYPHFLELEHDKIPTMEDVIAFQKQYQIILPEKYIQFLLNFGGGYFGTAIIYSLDKNSYFSIYNHNPAKVEDLLFMADNECGDYYAFQIENSKCSERIVFYDHDSNAIEQGTEFSDIFEYLVKTGLRSVI